MYLRLAQSFHEERQGNLFFDEINEQIMCMLMISAIIFATRN